MDATPSSSCTITASLRIARAHDTDGKMAPRQQTEERRAVSVSPPAFNAPMLAYAFAAAIGGFVPSALLLREFNSALDRHLPSACDTFLDSVFWLDAASIHPHLSCMGDAARAMHLNLYKFDFVLFPIIYATLLFSLVAFVWPNAKPLRYIAVATGCFDVLENASNLFLLMRFPQRSQLVEHCASISSRGKYVGLIASLTVVAVGIALRGCSLLMTRTVDQGRGDQKRNKAS